MLKNSLKGVKTFSNMSKNSATYTNHPSRVAKSRIRIDANEIMTQDETLKFRKGIYYQFNVENTIDTHYKMLIIGPEDSPYVGGFYLFNGQFPDQYPFYPMTMKTMTQGGGVRKHPNLYTSGKCCFSFLGTWSGPPWTSCQNPDSVGISMRSVLTNNPITNEPGWEKRNDDKTKIYEDMIKYFNIKYAVCNVLSKINSGSEPYDSFLYFKDRINTHFVYNYEKNYYHDLIKSIKSYNGKNISSPVYGFSLCFDIDNVKMDLDTLYKKIKPLVGKVKDPESEKKSSKTAEEQHTDVPINSNDDLSDEVSISSTTSSKSSGTKSSGSKTKLKIKKKYTRKAPKEKAKEYELGFKKTGLDGNEYKIVENKNGVKRWVKS